MNKNTDISERLIQVIEYLGITRNEFAKNLGYDRAQAIYDMTKGKAKPSFDFFERFLNSEYSDKINIDWLITNRGAMIRKKENQTQGSESKDDYIIQLQREKIAELEKKLKKLKKQLSSVPHYTNIAEPDS